MVKYAHTENRTDTAADDRNDKECGFRNSPKVLFGLVFIQIHTEKADQIYDYKIDNSSRDESFAEEYKDYTNDELFDILEKLDFEQSKKLH